jgi:hypothetical protein
MTTDQNLADIIDDTVLQNFHVNRDALMRLHVRNTRNQWAR